MPTITRWSNVFEVQREQARLSNQEDWTNRYFWNEFLRLRKKFFSEQIVSVDAPEVERRQLAVLFKEWVKASAKWWGGDWVDAPDLADWHVNQYVRKLKAKQGEPSGSNAREVARSDQGTPGQGSYWDPVRSSQQG